MTDPSAETACATLVPASHDLNEEQCFVETLSHERFLPDEKAAEMLAEVAAAYREPQ